MQKIIFTIFCLGLLLPILTGCSTKPNKVLPRKEGKWARQYCQYIDGQKHRCEDGEFYFDRDGTGKDDVYGNFTWEYKDGKISLNHNGSVREWNVVEAKKDYEHWTDEPRNVGSATGQGTSSLQHHVFLTRK